MKLCSLQSLWFSCLCAFQMKPRYIRAMVRFVQSFRREAQTEALISLVTSTPRGLQQVHATFDLGRAARVRWLLAAVDPPDPYQFIDPADSLVRANIAA